MKRLCIALAVAALLLLTVGVGTAAAEDAPESQVAALPGDYLTQDVPAADESAQQEPTIESETMNQPKPDDAGSVDQTNDATSDGTAGNLNATKQDADQDQDGSGIQAIGQSAKNDQDALALAFTLQKGASNSNTPVRVGSKGDGGDVTQENTATSDATAGNLNLTKQDAEQEQSGDDCKCADGGIQAIGQSAKSEQDATAAAKTVQVKPSNTNISVRVLSPGDDGDVTQSNTASSNATAGNINLTKQDADQKQEGDCKCSGGEQAIGQFADNDQDAKALAATVQEKPSNKNISVRVLSEGDDGDVTQSNTASSNATAGNINLTKQDADQKQDGGSGTQAIGQSADSDQDALAASLTAQKEPSNTNISVRVLSPGKGGSVTQSNTASSNATAGNLNATKQDADQKQEGDCKCSGGEQAIGQFAKNDQDATALSATFQLKPSNTNTSVRVLSKGDDGDVSQTNEATSSATAGNLNLLSQDADQKQDGGSGIQAIGQFAKNDQDATALAATFQIGASNENTPVRVGSKGDSGSVTQSNVASSDATAFNVNLTKQDADQKQGGRHDDKDGKDDKHECCGFGIQAIGQLAKNDQDAKAVALTFQVGGKRPCSCSHEPSFGNSNTPVLVGSKGDGGSVSQSNTATSDADALNVNLTKQTAEQDQKTPCKCWEAFGIQAIGQSSESEQDAFALAATFQVGAKNTNAPTRIGDHGKKGHDRKGHDRTNSADRTPE